MDIRSAETEDIDDIQEVARRSWNATYTDILGEETIEETVKDWYSKKTLEDAIRMPDSVFLVAEDDDELAGFSHAICDSDEADLLRLYVDPDHWRKGIGTELLERTREELAKLGMERMRVFVLAENEIGNSFYQGLGFEKADESETEIGDETHTENAYIIDINSG